MEDKMIFDEIDALLAMKRAPPPRPLWKDLLFLAAKIAAIALAFVLLFTLLFGIAPNQDQSMAPAIKDGDLVLFYRHAKEGYLPQDTVALNKNGLFQVRRVVAVAGDTVDFSEGGLLVNGALQYEPDIYQKTERYETDVNFPMTVPEGHVFLLGDSRDGATDSRVYGAVRIRDTMGKVMTVIRRRGI